MPQILPFLRHHLQPYKKTILAYTALAVVAAALDTTAPMIMGRGLDRAKEAGGSGPAAMLALLMIGAWFLIRTVAERIRSRISERGQFVSGAAAERYVRGMLVQLLNKPLAFHYGKRSQELADKVMEMRWSMEYAIAGLVFDMWPTAVALVAMLGYVTFLDWRIGLSLLVSVGLFLWYTNFTIRQVLAMRKEMNEANRKLSSFGWDSVRNALVVKSTSNEALVSEQLAKYAKDAEALLIRENALDRRVLDNQNLIIGVGSCAALLIAVYNLIRGDFTFGTVTAITAYSFAVFGYVRYGQWQFRALQRLQAALKDMAEIDAEPAEDFASGVVTELAGGVEFRGVRFRYREDKATLEDVSFVVRPGQRIAIVGESGEGKTTLVDLLGRYYVPQGGQILLDGRDATEVNLAALRRQMAYVPQDLTLFHETLGFNIRYGRPDASDEEVREAARQAALDGFISALPEGYETMVGERGLKLSGGERQRVALARAFLRRPKMIVLDEPTAHLDSKTEELVQRSLATLMAGRTTFIIAHRLRTVQDADLILVLKDGRIVESGSHAELVARGGAYSELLRAQGGFIDPTEKHVGEEVGGVE